MRMAEKTERRMTESCRNNGAVQGNAERQNGGVKRYVPCQHLVSRSLDISGSTYTESGKDG